MCMGANDGKGGAGNASNSAPSSRMRLMTLFGAGLLTGTALIVIIPEGIEMWLGAQAAIRAAAEKHEAAAATTTGARGATPSESHHEHHDHHDNHWQIGAALASGFAFMLVVEKLGAGDGGANHGHAHVSVSEPTRIGSGLELGGLTGLGGKRDDKKKGEGKSSTAILGLIVHAAIDGVALGASSYSGNGAVSFIIFAAIMLHKAPAAFGLSVYLASLGHNRRAVQKRLFVFSLAAPVGAIVTYYGM
jgi:zinc transporter 9